MMTDASVLMYSLFNLLALLVTKSDKIGLDPVKYLFYLIIRRIQDGVSLIWLYDPVYFDAQYRPFVKFGYLSNLNITLYFSVVTSFTINDEAVSANEGE